MINRINVGLSRPVFVYAYLQKRTRAAEFFYAYNDMPDRIQTRRDGSRFGNRTFTKDRIADKRI